MSGSLSVAETHVSVLVFLDDLVLKFKKPLQMPFVDFRRAEARRLACVEEVEANRRLSPDVYLGVAALRLEDTAGSVAAGDMAGTTVADDGALEHAVVMRRMPDERRLSRLVERGTPDLAPRLRHLADLLADFHGRAAHGPAIDAAARPKAITEIWRGCLDTLTQFSGRMVDGEVVTEIDRLASAYIAGRTPLFERRIAAGRVCDGHGDLLADDIYILDDGPRVLDCIEFDRPLRYVDVIADVAFLAMDLERLGEAALADSFLRSYQRASGDHFPPTLLDHYWAERAVVRAEVTCLRAEQTSQSHPAQTDPSQADPAHTASSLLEMARRHLRRGRVVLVVVSGLPGTGKSSVAAALGDRLDWPVLRSDEIRRELVAPGHSGPLRVAEFPGAYDAEVSARTYSTLLERARTSLGLGQPVLVDATFADERGRRHVEAVAEDTSSELVVLRCRCSSELAAVRMGQRLAAGNDVSGADEAVARAMALQGPGEWPGALEVDTSGTLESAVASVVATGLLPLPHQ